LRFRAARVSKRIQASTEHDEISEESRPSSLKAAPRRDLLLWYAKLPVLGALKSDDTAAALAAIPYAYFS
jgi:hypothetical protein